MLRRLLPAGLLLAGALLMAGCACHKCHKREAVAAAPPCCPPAAPPCCPGPPGSTIPPPPGTSGYAPPIVAIPGH
ncbi:MAG TPA: hypothetical protein VFW33_15595 [Gemmataceae bacterium]|nr:hypothetical protein [Gemmataceae bacterium]